MEFVLYLVLIIFCTKIAGDLSVRIGQPAVLGKLVLGIVLGPAVLGWISGNEFIHYFAEIGVLLLMFMAGIETDLDQLKKNWKSAVAVAIGGILVPFWGGWAVAESFGLSNSSSLFMGVVFSATSVSISVQVLKEMNRLNSREGTTILGAAVVDDVLVVILLAFIMSFLGAGSEIPLGILIGKKLVFFIVITLAGWFLVPRLMKILSKLRVTEPVVSIALAICFGFAYFVDLMGMAGIIGAFAAGLAISQTSFKHAVETKVEPIAYSIFVPVFFVSIGLNVTFDGVGGQLVFLVILTVVAILTKFIGATLGARFTGFNLKSAMGIGSGMISRGEVALIMASTGLQAGLLLPEYFTSVVIMVIVTTLVAPPLLKLSFK
ncbi:cation:proton antiporter [Paenibacillus sp. HN-1]|uniref:cation:proton antiporter n=1 Tax=Paenibacillus TaxID=44249 RepID=UPI001CAA2691|nr:MULTISPECIES: cation:proton antiporter [Paenibacillus]MBY9081590.1 cation:proton antiporter [Paenibacillus sp. CGMCC 1.18879]MBY9083459.1 cation:proton antiporter [Paenibacillus sinensis]